MMRLDELTQLMQQQESCPKSLPGALQALWYANQKQWHKAHEIVQNASDADSAWVHAYLHRQEGDLSNARYWYQRSGKPEAKVSLQQEWEQIAKELLQQL